MNDRDELMRRMAADMDVPQDIVETAFCGAAESFFTALRQATDRERVWMSWGLDIALPVVCEEVTRDFLRPGLRAAGFDGDVADQYEVTYVREDGFRPGLFAQEGVEYGRCPASECPPWPQADTS